MSSTAPSSPPPSPQAPTLHVPTLSRILVWSIRWRERAVASTSEGVPAAQANASGTLGTRKRLKTHHLECSSGSELKTHGRLIECNPECRKCDVIVHQDVFTCLDAVDTVRLLMLSRRRVLEKVQLLEGNALIEERWSCTIYKHHDRRGDVYKVSIYYQGTPARSSLPDPQTPVAVTEARGVPGLMTIVSRE